MNPQDNQKLKMVHHGKKVGLIIENKKYVTHI